MTLTYGLIADGGIVLAADSQITNKHTVLNVGHSRITGTYQGVLSKIRKLPDGSAFSIAGNAGLVDLLLQKTQFPNDLDGFDERIAEFAVRLKREYVSVHKDEENRPQCAFLFCGYNRISGQPKPRIVKLSSDTGFMFNAVGVDYGYGFTGAEEHGGVLYLHHRLYANNMPLEIAKRLVYCVLAEVADLDTSVGPPIEMVVVRESGVEPISPDDLVCYEQKRKDITTLIRSAIQTH